jgi:hypothetical protein
MKRSVSIRKIVTHTPILHVAALFGIAASPATVASAACKDVTVSARGTEKTKIEDAQASAVDTLVASIAKRYGKSWGTGSHRYGSFHCDKFLGYRASWTCTAKTTVICSPEG